MPPEKLIVIREAVVLFSEEMEKKLQENDYKGGWGRCTQIYLRNNIDSQMQQYKEDHDPKRLLNIANYAMMLWHRQKHNRNYK